VSAGLAPLTIATANPSNQGMRLALVFIVASCSTAAGPQTPNPFYKLDMFYDYNVGMIGIAPKP
jgi:hypothetical protein